MSNDDKIKLNHEGTTLGQILGMTDDEVTTLIEEGKDRRAYIAHLLLNTQGLDDCLTLVAATLSVMAKEDLMKPSMLVEYLYNTMDDKQLYQIINNWGLFSDQFVDLENPEEEIKES